MIGALLHFPLVSVVLIFSHKVGVEFCQTDGLGITAQFTRRLAVTWYPERFGYGFSGIFSGSFSLSRHTRGVVATSAAAVTVRRGRPEHSHT